jgi:hypothetical protein
MLSERVIYATESASDFGDMNTHVSTAFAWENAVCTVSSIGRAADS